MPYGTIIRAHPGAPADVRIIEQEKSKRRIQPTRLTGSPGCLAGSFLTTEQQERGMTFTSSDPDIDKEIGLAGCRRRAPKPTARHRDECLESRTNPSPNNRNLS